MRCLLTVFSQLLLSPLDPSQAMDYEAEWVKHVDRVKANDREYADKGGYSMEDCHTVQLLNSFLHSGPNG